MEKGEIARIDGQVPAQPYTGKEKKSFFTREIKLFERSPGTRDFMLFCRHFAALTGAGITLLKSLQLLGEQTENSTLRERVKEVAFRVEGGYSLAESFKANGDIFPVFFSSMVEAGEAGGFLGTALERLAVYLEKQYELEQKIKSATMYPKFIACAAIAALIFMVVAVLPSFAGIFENMGIRMPALTRLLISTGNLLLSYWYLFVLIILAAFILGKGFLRTTPGRLFFDRLRLHNPLLGPFYRKMLAARFCHTLGTLLGNGVAMLPSLDLVKKVMENGVYGENISRAKGGIIQGLSLASALEGVNYFPPLVVEMCKVGEQTGNLEGMLASTASFFETEVSYFVDRICSLIEPVLILLVAGVVVVIALSVLLPMFEVYQMI